MEHKIDEIYELPEPLDEECWDTDEPIDALDCALDPYGPWGAP